MTDLFNRSGDRIGISLSVEDKALLVQIPDLLSSVGADEADPALPVLNRSAYRDDDTAAREYEQLIESQRVRDRAADVAALDGLLRGSPSVSMEEAEAVLRVLNRARLTLAARAGVFEDGAGWESRISEDPALAALAWLGYLQSDLLSALMESAGPNW